MFCLVTSFTLNYLKMGFFDISSSLDVLRGADKWSSDLKKQRERFNVGSSKSLGPKRPYVVAGKFRGSGAAIYIPFLLRGIS